MHVIFACLWQERTFWVILNSAGLLLNINVSISLTFISEQENAWMLTVVIKDVLLISRMVAFTFFWWIYALFYFNFDTTHYAKAISELWMQDCNMRCWSVCYGYPWSAYGHENCGFSSKMKSNWQSFEIVLFCYYILITSDNRFLLDSLVLCLRSFFISTHF